MATPFTLRVEDVVYTRIEKEGVQRPPRADDQDLVRNLLEAVNIERTRIEGQVAFSWHPYGYFFLNPEERSGIADVTQRADYTKSNYELKRSTPLFCELSQRVGRFVDKYRILFSHTPPENL